MAENPRRGAGGEKIVVILGLVAIRASAGLRAATTGVASRTAIERYATWRSAAA